MEEEKKKKNKKKPADDSKMAPIPLGNKILISKT